MLENNLHNAEDPEALIVYGGTGKAARDAKSLAAIKSNLQTLRDDETLLIQSGKPVAVFETWEHAPRVLMANSNLVPRWSNWEHFRALEERGLMMYGQMTAGSWCYIGTQGIIQGTYETFAAAGRAHFAPKNPRLPLAGRIVLTGGLGGMGGAQPLAVTMNGGACLIVEVDEARAQRRKDAGFVQHLEHDRQAAVQRVEEAGRRGQAVSVGLIGNCAEEMPALLAEGFAPDLVTDQTSAHDPVDGYVPAGMSLAASLALRRKDPQQHRDRAYASMAEHVRAMAGFMDAGAHAFDYGNNLREGAALGGLERARAYAFPGFVPAYLRPMFCEGRGPFRWLSLQNRPQDIHRTGALVKEMFDDGPLSNWIDLADANLPWEGLAARVCWLGYGERDRFALAMNELVADGELGPIAVTRDHLDCGSVASPYRETEGMRDGSDAVADWPLLNALVNTAAGADSVHIHNGGGVGIGYSTHAGQVVVLDGSELAREKARRVFRTDPGMGIVRHADAGYPEALAVARAQKVRTPLV
jgi:urocanate hydratase